MMRRAIVGVAALVAALASGGGVRAEWPDKPVKFVSAFGPGTATDTVARLLAQEMAVLLKQPVVVENKPGANGIIAAEAVKNAAPDGYTVLITTSTTHAGNPAMYKSLPYDPVKDFMPLGQLTSSLAILLVGARTPASTPQELVALAKKQPGKLTFGSGNGSSRISGEMFKSATGIDILHVPYRSAPQALADLLAGQIDLMFIDPIAGMAAIKSGQARALGVTGAGGDRLRALPDVKTFDEQGIPGVVLTAWNAAYVPAGTPQPIVDKLAAAMRRATEQPRYQEVLASLGSTSKVTTPAELAAFQVAEIEKWRKAVREAGIPLE